MSPDPRSLSPQRRSSNHIASKVPNSSLGPLWSKPESEPRVLRKFRKIQCTLTAMILESIATSTTYAYDNYAIAQPTADIVGSLQRCGMRL